MKLSLLPPRSYEQEILDGPDNTDSDIAAAMRDIDRINRWLGGIRALWRPLRAILRRDRITQLDLLDVGTGGGEMPRAIALLAAREGVAVRPAGIDIDPKIVRYAGRAPELAVLRADAFRLPFADRAFDVVSSSMMFHHFREDDAARLLAEMDRVARRAVIVNDLARGWVPWAAIRVLGALAESHMVRHDGPLSVLKGWTRQEMLGLARAAGVAPRTRVDRRFPYRLVLTVEAGEAVRKSAGRRGEAA